MERGRQVLEEAKKEASLLEDTLIREKRGQKNYENHVEEFNLEPIKEIIYSNEQQQMEDVYIRFLLDEVKANHISSQLKI